jgi:fanconi-associated nuclease 1
VLFKKSFEPGLKRPFMDREIIDLIDSVDSPDIIEISDNEETELKTKKITNETVTINSYKDSPSYYQRAFISILSTVVEVYSIILSEVELEILNLIIKQLSIPAQRLFIRLILRKVGWHRCKKLIYDDIPSVNEAIEELALKSLCIVESEDIMDYLNILTVQELRTIASTKLFLKTGTNSNQREDLIRLVLEAKPSGQQRISFSKEKLTAVSASSHKTGKLEIIRETSGEIIKISDHIRQLIETAISLYFLVSQNGQENLSTAILVEINRRSYPKYKIIRNFPIFKSRDDFLEYQRALELENLLKDAENEEKAIESLDEIKRNFESCLLSCDMERSYFLRRYTAGWVYCRILSHLASILETLKKYSEAIEIYKILLLQEIYCCGYRGKWWERTVLDTSKHLKDSIGALELCESALKDPWLRTSALTSIKRRQKKLKKSEELELTGFELEVEDEPEIITIKGRIQGGNVTGKKVKLHLDGDDLTLGSVEEFVLNEFSRDGWEGVHSESSCFTTLFSLLFWDLLFEINVPDVFQTVFQTAPLDLNTDAFYPSRTTALEGRLKLIEEDFDAALKLLQKHHVTYHLVSCVGVNWSDYSGEEGITLLIKVARGIGGMALSLILRQFCEDYRHNRSGMPDLILWRSSTDSSELIDHANGLIFAEVKSPNDRLSDGQRHWFSLLKNGGLRVVLVRVLGEITEISENGNELEAPKKDQFKIKSTNVQ